MLIEIGTWQVPSENSETHLEVAQTLVVLQRAKRDEMLYKEVRFYTEVDEEASVEHWMYIDFFENLEDCQKHWDMLEKDEGLKAALENVMSQIVPDSLKTSRWIEKDELRL
ncbi:MAG: hypothetical protein JSW05_06545 [Candidatus Thorarchaeota archaeon]|nr:MAG: hypothetical protein JSW05_06545 [Candidatus Thorarchaeota archaeon]